MSKLSPAMLDVLRTIAQPHPDDEPLPPRHTVLALERRGLVTFVDDPDDVVARLLGAVRIQVTPAGVLALSGHLLPNEARG